LYAAFFAAGVAGVRGKTGATGATGAKTARHYSTTTQSPCFGPIGNTAKITVSGKVLLLTW